MLFNSSCIKCFLGSIVRFWKKKSLKEGWMGYQQGLGALARTRVRTIAGRESHESRTWTVKFQRHPKKRNVDPSSRQMIYSKGRETILKKAVELSTFDDTDVGLLMFSPTGELTTYASKGRVEDMFLRYIEQQHDDPDGPLENEEFLCQSLKRLKFEAEMMDKMDRLEALQSKLNELNWLKYKSEGKMRFYKPDLSQIHSTAEADFHQEVITNALQKLKKLKAKLLEEEASSSNRTCDGASTSGRVGSS